MEPSDEFDPVFESMQKSARRRKGGKWGVRSSGTLTWHPIAQDNFHKREHNVFVVVDRQSELEARPSNQTGNAVYHYHYSYQGSFETSNRRLGPKALSSPNPNQAAPLSTVVLSLDKEKRWEAVESGSEDSNVAVITRPRGPSRMEYRTFNDLKRVGFVNRFVNRSLTNKPLENEDDEDATTTITTPKYKVTPKGRKGFTVRPVRSPGKRGVKKSTHHNTFSSELYDANDAETLIVAARAPKMSDFANTHVRIGGCRCSMCRDTRPNAHHRDKARFKKDIVQDL